MRCATLGRSRHLRGLLVTLACSSLMRCHSLWRTMCTLQVRHPATVCVGGSSTFVCGIQQHFVVVVSGTASFAEVSVSEMCWHS
jgi:hypothetical protein